MHVLVCALVHVVQAVLAALDVLDVLHLVQATALVHALVVQGVLDVALVVRVDARVDALILAALAALDAADVLMNVGQVANRHVRGVVALVLGAPIHVMEVVEVNAPQLVADANLAQEHVRLVVKAGALVALGVIAVVCIHVPVDALLVAINVVQHVGAVAMVALDAQDVLILVMANAADAAGAVKVDAILTVPLLVPDAMGVLILVRDAAIHVRFLVIVVVQDAALCAQDVILHAQATVLHHVKLPVLDVLDALVAVQHLVLDAADAQEIVLVDAKDVRRIVVQDVLVVVQHHAAIAARQAALLPVTPIAREHAMAHV